MTGEPHARAPEVDFAVLADAASVENGKAYIHGGGWDRIFSPAFPTTHGQMALAVRLRVPWGRANEKFKAEIDLVDDDGQSMFEKWEAPKPTQIVEVGRPAGTPHGADLSVSFTWTFQGLAFESPGAYTFVITLDGGSEKRLTFWLVQQ